MAKTQALTLALAALLGASGLAAPSADAWSAGPKADQAQQLMPLDSVPPAMWRVLPVQAGTTAPSAKPDGATAAAAAVLVNGRLTVPGAAMDGETVPSTVSARNASLDKLPIVAFRLRSLTEAQRGEIWQQLHSGSGALALTPAYAQIGAVLPPERALSPDLRPMPDSLISKFPELHGTSYLVEGSVVLIVSSNNNKVIGVMQAP
ncbi:MAG TPA: hypothetical protein VFZ16_18165 [Hyphomicrobiaceae bacterium]|nr:hypothetical protein [Hyphomicrobiaceae bacterium]